MTYDQYGQAFYNTDELSDLLYVNPELDLSRFYVTDPENFNSAARRLYVDFAQLTRYTASLANNVEEFDVKKQTVWHLPDTYKSLDIAAHILSLCKTESELQRVGHELLLFQERNLFDLLRFMKYLVDTLRENGIVWGVGRGSSVASYVLYLLGVHHINSLYYDLDITEFLK